jgi:hypothetical protein
MQPRHDRLTALEERLRDLQQQVTELTGRVQTVESEVPAAPRGHRPELAAVTTDAGGAWLVRSAVLRRIATISFVLVLALVLRTLTDSEVVTNTVGVRLGIGYSLLLVAVGWRHLAGNLPGRRVFTLCGALLLCALVLETHSRFDYLGTTTAHGLLIGTLVVCAALGLRYRTPVVVEAGVLAAAVTSLAIGFPTPAFHLTAATLLLAMLGATLVGGQRKTPWLHWVVLVLLLFFWLLWAAKLRAPLVRAEALPPSLQIGWFLPALAATFAVLLGIGYRRSRAGTDAFGLVLPTWNVLWSFGAAATVVVPWLDAGRWLGVAALTVAVLHLVLAWRFARATPANTAAAGSLALAATAAFVPGTWLATSSLSAGAATWGLAALGLAWWSGRLGSGGMRLLACCLQRSRYRPQIRRRLRCSPRPSRRSRHCTTDGPVRRHHRRAPGTGGCRRAIGPAN